jgi:hypothetical protein
MFKKILKFTIIFAIIFSWIFGYPPVYENFWRARIYVFGQEATSTPPTSPDITALPIQETTDSEDVQSAEEQVSPQPAEEPLAQVMPQPPLKERKLNKEIKLAKNARHSCAAKTFSINMSGQSQSIIELELGGAEPQNAALEIGSLPSGIDITFLNNAGYEWRPAKNENAAVLQIANQEGSQKGNFSIPILYTDGDSQETTICQINVINF